jgi:leucyl/phenylalanyl-tRNA--protein transferase
LLVRLGRDTTFPDPRNAAGHRPLAIGGDLSVPRLLAAYRRGIFPWYSAGEPILWWSLDPRCVLEVHQLRVPRSLAKRVRRGDYEIRFDTAFSEVVARCATVPRPGQSDTWITPEVAAAYGALHEAGAAHSVEAWHDGALVGGLYGVAVGGVFCGESMFADADDASKVAFVTLVRHLQVWDFALVDAQMSTPHLTRFGAQSVPRAEFLDRLAVLVDRPTARPALGRWTDAFDPALAR